MIVVASLLPNTNNEGKESPPWTKWPPFRRRHFQMYFLECKCIDFNQNFTEVYSQWSSWQYSSTGSDNDLALTRRQAIIWTNADPIHWRIYAALEGDVLIHSYFSYSSDLSLTPIENLANFSIKVEEKCVLSTCCTALIARTCQRPVKKHADWFCVN